MTRYQAGDLAAFEELYARFAPRVRGWLAKLRLAPGADPEDLAQETFLQMHRSRHTWSPARPFEPWAFAIARNVYRMDCRSRSRKQGRETAIDHEPAAEGDTPEAETMRRLGLDRALAGTTAKRRASLLLHHLWGLSFKEIGRLLAVNPAAAKLRARRGAADVRRALEDGREDEHEDQA
jgi:RNA polymerase sigma-70 factor (ECF subfamily)